MKPDLFPKTTMDKTEPPKNSFLFIQFLQYDSIVVVYLPRSDDQMNKFRVYNQFAIKFFFIHSSFYATIPFFLE